MKKISQLLTDRDLFMLIHSLDRVPARKPRNVVNGRARFLREARDLSTNMSQPVSVSSLDGLMVWIKKYIPVGKSRKEVNMMWMKFSIVALVLAMVFGGAVTAVQAAEASLPGQMIYPLKIIVEDVQVIAANPVDQVHQSMLRLETRIQEILRLREKNKVVPESAYQRVENQLELTLQLMLGLTDSELGPELVNVQSRLMVQEKLLQELQNQAQMSDDPVIERLRTMLQTRLQLLGDGIGDPEQFRVLLRDRDRDRDSWSEDGNPPANGQGAGTSVGPGPAMGTPTPRSYGPGPGPVGNTPTAGGYGPGPGPIQNTPTPGAYGPGPGPIQNTPTPGAYGPGPGPIQNTPTPGAYGPGPGPIQNTPTAGAYGPGPGPIQNTPTPGAYGPGPGPIENTPTPGAYGPGASPTQADTPMGNKP